MRKYIVLGGYCADLNVHGGSCSDILPDNLKSVVFVKYSLNEGLRGCLCHFMTVI